MLYLSLQVNINFLPLLISKNVLLCHVNIFKSSVISAYGRNKVNQPLFFRNWKVTKDQPLRTFITHNNILFMCVNYNSCLLFAPNSITIHLTLTNLHG